MGVTFEASLNKIGACAPRRPFYDEFNCSSNTVMINTRRAGYSVDKLAPIYGLQFTFVHEAAHAFGAKHLSKEEEKYGTIMNKKVSVTKSHSESLYFHNKSLKSIGKYLFEHSKYGNLFHAKCFQRDPNRVGKCQNGILEEGEECDGNSPCCTETCHLMPLVGCDPYQPCCTFDCKTSLIYKPCNFMGNCERVQLCNGRSHACCRSRQLISHKTNGFECEDGVCLRGKCIKYCNFRDFKSCKTPITSCMRYCELKGQCISSVDGKFQKLFADGQMKRLMTRTNNICSRQSERLKYCDKNATCVVNHGGNLTFKKGRRLEINYEEYAKSIIGERADWNDPKTEIREKFWSAMTAIFSCIGILLLKCTACKFWKRSKETYEYSKIN
ncbi:unnamed protein product [Dimorphilus gyrociliatus]|uniref:Disintegrin domain-containing protein n=1 Tax=Dimorphilus gyrociliatus TaxID=2664684 RepID=A0A7I8VLA4_9ANNE|nr:unnamed protein product [Dimorphilus gyrociliatus]